MRRSPHLLLAGLLVALSAEAHGQDVRVLTETGCGTPFAPTVAGPLRIGTTVRFTDLGHCKPGSNPVGPSSLFLGLELPRPSWLIFSLDSPVSCRWAVGPILAEVPAAVNASGSFVPIRIPVPNDPALMGAAVAAQAACSYFGRYADTTRAIVLTLG